MYFDKVAEAVQSILKFKIGSRGLDGQTFINTNQHVWSPKSHLSFSPRQSPQHLNKYYYYILNLLLKKSFTSSKLNICVSKQAVFWAKPEWKNDFSVYPDCSSEASLSFMKPQSCISTLLRVLPVYPVCPLFRFLGSMTSTFCIQGCEWFLIFTSTITADSAFSLEKRLQLSSVKLTAPNFI